MPERLGPASAERASTAEGPNQPQRNEVVMAAGPDWLPLVAADRVAVGGDRLRHWGISETWRVHWADGTSAIVKRAAGEEAKALDVYEHLLIPHEIPAPRLIARHRGAGFVVLMFEDAGRHSLAERPSVEGWLASARLLARLRSTAGMADAGRFRFGTAEIVETWVRAAAALARVRPDLAGALDACRPLLAPSFQRLADLVPETIVHGDFESKNIVLTDAGPGPGADVGLCAVDWSSARVSADLGDLYSLLRDARRAGGPVDAMIAAYAEQAAPTTDLEWQLALGGVVWTLRALRWVLEEGVHVVPEAITWIDELVDRAGHEAATLSRAAVT